jgi:membrane-bound serine protease (ClpP class)
MKLSLALLLLPVLAAASTPPVTVLTLDGPISPASAAYVTHGLQQSVAAGAQLVVLRIDTPGGLDTAMRDIIKEILASPVPVATFVAPSGARAASAGTYILYASHIAAMAPGTNLGAATPVQIGLGGPSHDPLPPADGGSGAEKGSEKPPATTSPSALEQKQIHDSSAYMRSLAQMRGRNAEWGERAVREAVSLTAEEALALHVVDYVVPDVHGLLVRLQGKRVTVGGATVTLQTADAEAVAVDPDWRTRLLSVIASPSLALMLMMLGIYGLVFEFTNPGYVLPGVVGGISLLLALFAFQMLPINYTGLALIVLGMAFLVAEVFLPTSGALGVGGVLAFVIGAVILVDTDAPGYGIPVPLVVALAGLCALFVFVVVRLGVKARRRPLASGIETLVDGAGEALADFEGEGWASIRGEIWRVHSTLPLTRGQRVRVSGVHGAVPEVAPQSEKEGSKP